jgi:inner membrane protein involved in colicin E2 resistance
MSTVRPEQKYFLTGALIVAVLLLLAAAEHMGWW